MSHSTLGARLSTGTKGRLVAAVVAAASLPLVGVVWFAGGASAATAAPPEAVQNPRAALSLAGWSGSSGGAKLSLRRLTGVVGPFPTTTAVQITRPAVASTWTEVLAQLTNPATLFKVGSKYLMSLWVRDARGSGAPIGILLANANYQHSPTTASVWGGYTDRTWHQLTKTFTATATGSADTQLYVSLPGNDTVNYVVTRASVHIVPPVGASPTASTTTAPTATATPSRTATPTPSRTATPTPTATPPGATTPAAHDYVQNFSTDVTSWPSSGAPAGYPGFCAYADGTGGKYYPSKVVTVHDGLLDFYDHDSMAAAILPFCYTGFTYGTYTVRMRQAGAYQGYHNAFLLWPNSGTWPAAGEFDYPENETSATNPYVAVVQPDGSFLPANQTFTPRSWTDGLFHNYTLQWGPGFLRAYQDGVLIATVTGNIPSSGMHPVLQNEFSNTLQNGAKPNSSLSGHTYVDSVTYDSSYTIAPSAF